MGDTKRQQSVPFSSITNEIERYIKNIYPDPCCALDVVGNVRCSIPTARRLLARLASDKNRDVERYCRGFYIGRICRENLGNLECPEHKMHNIKIQFIPVGTKRGDSPPTLNIQRTNKSRKQHTEQRYWNYEGYPYRITFQFNPTETITVHMNASKKPLSQLALRDFLIWLDGAFSAFELNAMKYKSKILLFEINKDYEKVTITPKMLEIRDLLNKSWFRIYRKYRNLTRLEIGTTFEGDKKIYQLFKEFGENNYKCSKQDSYSDVV